MRIIRVQGSNLRVGSNFWSSEGERGVQGKIAGPPSNFEFLFHFYVTISKIFSILKSLRGVQSRSLMALGGGHPPLPPLDMYVPPPTMNFS